MGGIGKAALGFSSASFGQNFDFCPDGALIRTFLEAVGMMENDVVELSRADDNIVITKVEEKKELTLED